MDHLTTFTEKMLHDHFSLLQLTSSYDSNKFTETLIALNEKIRNKPIEEIRDAFEQQLVTDLTEAKEVEVTTPFEWIFFSGASRLNMPYRFTKYFFARIDHFIAGGTEETAESYHNLVRRTGYKNGYQIEHILSHNEDNFALFEEDEDLFNTERNKLGAILLLQGRDNMASQNELYKEKIKIYATRRLIWNKTLSQNFYHKNPNFKDFGKAYNLEFKSYDIFDNTAVLDRQKLLFEMVKIIWA